MGPNQMNLQIGCEEFNRCCKTKYLKPKMRRRHQVQQYAAIDYIIDGMAVSCSRLFFSTR
jgi:hypothetical protein